MRMKFPGSARSWERRLRKYGSTIARPDPGWRPPRGIRTQEGAYRAQIREQERAYRAQNRAYRTQIREQERANRQLIRDQKARDRAREKELKITYIADKVASAGVRNNELEAEVSLLTNLLSNSLNNPISFSFEMLFLEKNFEEYCPPTELIQPLKVPLWDEYKLIPPERSDYNIEYCPPAELIQPLKAPLWDEYKLIPLQWYNYAVEPLNWFNKILPWIRKAQEKRVKEAERKYQEAQKIYGEKMAKAKLEFEEAQKRHAEAEAKRKQKLEEGRNTISKEAERKYQEAQKIYGEKMAKAKLEFEEAQKRHEKAEAGKKQRLEEDKWLYNLNKAKYFKQIDDINNEIMQIKEQYLKHLEPGIIYYFSHVLDRSPYPEYFEIDFDINYSGESCTILIDFQLPSDEIIPKEKIYRYIKIRDEIKVIESSNKEINNLYKGVVFSIALRTIHELCVADQNDDIDVIDFRGYIVNEDSSEQDLITITVTKQDLLALNLTDNRLDLLIKQLKANISLFSD